MSGGMGFSKGISVKTTEGKKTREKIQEIITASFALKDYGNTMFIKSILFDLLDRIEELETKISASATVD